MYVTIPRPDNSREIRQLVLSGIAFTAALALLVALSIAIYSKAFSRYTTLTLETSRAGLQLAELGDVRYHGVLVGQIREISQTGDKAVIRLGLDRDLATQIPGNVDAQIIPTTLFGAKYVDLTDPARPSPTKLQDGTLIPASRVKTSTELSKVLADLFPLLRAVRPADLNRTLSALADTLEGRGEQIGSMLERLHTYLDTLNRHLPALRRDLELLDSVAGAYADAAPDLLAALRDLTVTANTVFTNGPELARLLRALTTLSDNGTQFLADNADALDRALTLSEPILGLLEKYAPQHYCLLAGLHAVHPILNKVYEGGYAKQILKFPVPQVRAYDERDVPAYEDKRGPRCLGLPDNPPDHPSFSDLANGTDLDTAAGRGPVTLVPGGLTNTATVNAFTRTALGQPASEAGNADGSSPGPGTALDELLGPALNPGED